MPRQRGKNYPEEYRQSIINQLPESPNYAQIKALANENDINDTTVISWVKRAGRQVAKSERGAQPKHKIQKYTEAKRLELNSEVLIVQCWDGQVGEHQNKRGILRQVHKSGRMRVELSNGDICTASKVSVINHETMKIKMVKSSYPKQLKRWVLDYADRHPSLTITEIAEKLGTTRSAMYQWKADIRKDARKYPMYSEDMARDWENKYFAKPKQNIMEEIDDQIAVEEVQRVYLFTEGNHILKAKVQAKDNLIFTEVNIGVEGHKVSVYGEVEKIEAIAKMMLGAVKMARTLRGDN